MNLEIWIDSWINAENVGALALIINIGCFSQPVQAVM